jgi:8-oxo-dGTP diphosphatase
MAKRIGGKYDGLLTCPAGKVDFGEDPKTTIIREIKEELELDIQISKPFLSVFHEYPDFAITMHGFLCNAESDQLVLNEHIDFKWLSIQELDQLDWAAADIPFVNKLKN